MMPIQDEEILLTATFNPKVKTYIFLVVIFYLVISFIGIVLLPFWLLGLGQWLSGRFFKTLSCQLSNKNLKFSKGLIIHIEKTIPLENIQDLSFIGGPLLRSFGLTMIKVETAGGGGGGTDTLNMMTMIGIENPETFKTSILQQREKVIAMKNQGNYQAAPSVKGEGNEVLEEINAEMKKMNAQLGTLIERLTK